MSWLGEDKGKKAKAKGMRQGVRDRQLKVDGFELSSMAQALKSRRAEVSWERGLRVGG